jgi:hypothetical protein
MKILDSIKTVFNDKQKRQLQELFFKKIGEGKIPWKDVYTENLKKRLPNLIDGLKLDRMPAKNKININKINEQLEDIDISLVSLAAESEEINQTLSRHEMFRKDDVKSFFNISQNYVDMVNNEVKDYRTNNVTVQNGIVEMVPSLITEFQIKTVEVEYFPDNLIDRLGNDPTPENLTPGTDKNYWLSEILTQKRTTVGASVIIGFNGNVNFNKLILSLAGKYPITVQSVEIKEGDQWREVQFTGSTTTRFTQLTMIDENGDSIAFQCEEIRLTFIQDKPDFVWSRTIDNEEEILRGEEKTRIVNDVIYNDKFEISREQEVKNIFSYIFGLYYIRVMLQKYSAHLTGNFYSRKFSIEDSFKYITINSEEYKPTPFEISYKIIQHDGSIASVEGGSILPNTKMKLINLYSYNQIISGVNTSFLKLSHYPITVDFLCKLNGYPIRLVESFDEKNDYQVMIRKNILFFSKRLRTIDTVEVFYKHYTDNITVQATFEINSTNDTVDCPRILNFSVGLE